MNGIRWAFVYAEDVERVGAEMAPRSDVWPEFLDEVGASLPKTIPLIGEFNAVMHIVSRNMVEVHFQRLALGTKFFCVEASWIVAEGLVTSLSRN